MLTIICKHYFGLDGLGIKKVAPAFGLGSSCLPAKRW